MDIREVKRSDWPALEALVRAAFHENYRTTSEALLDVETLDDKLRTLLEEFDGVGARFLGAASMGAAPPPRGDEPRGVPPRCAATGPRPATALRAEQGADVSARFLGAFDGDRALGAILARRPHRGRVWIEDIFVAPDARRRGLARELCAAAVDPGEEVSAEVNLKNAAALEMFAALGFVRILENAVFRREGKDGT